MMFNDKWVEENKPCKEGLAFLNSQTDKSAVSVINALVSAKHYKWADWALTKSFTKRQSVMYAVYAAEQVIDIFEKECPKDKRPRAAIEVTKRWLDGKATEQECRDAAASAYAAYYAASAYAASAYAAYAAAAAASYAAYAADAAYAASRGASDAAYAAASAASRGAANAMREKIIAYGLTLLSSPKKRKSLLQRLFMWTKLHK